ncbi:MGMT family protein, partial [Candidatus Woesearchaeota archaeon]|nr:MGMT family protein [Candidatus Woesearchaeota archaeon]
MPSESFNEKIYELLKKVPKGKVTTYKELAHSAGTRAYRAVGQAMRCNPYAPIVP